MKQLLIKHFFIYFLLFKNKKNSIFYLTCRLLPSGRKGGTEGSFGCYAAIDCFLRSRALLYQAKVRFKISIYVIRMFEYK